MRFLMRTSMVVALAILGAPGAAAELIETPSVDGVTLGSTITTVKARLGPARKSRSLGTDADLGMGELRELRFDGIRVFMNRPKPTEEFRVYEIRVSGKTRKLSNGLTVKMSPEAVTARLGAPEGTEDDKKGGTTLVYLFKDRDGRLLVHVRGGEVVCLEILEENS